MLVRVTPSDGAFQRPSATLLVTTAMLEALSHVAASRPQTGSPKIVWRRKWSLKRVLVSHRASLE